MFRRNGILTLYKPAVESSTTILDILKNILYPKSKASFNNPDKFRTNHFYKKPSRSTGKWKVGHGGTLDPFADGLLVVGLGDGCRSLGSYLTSAKQYNCKVALGFSADTQDITGLIDEIKPYDFITEKSILDILPSFTGEIHQNPPMYSALKLDGKPLYEYARKRLETPEFDKGRMIHIHNLRLDSFSNLNLNNAQAISERPDLKLGDSARDILKSKFSNFGFTVDCGKGTYVRTLAKDMCSAVGTTGFLTQLTRIKQGPFQLGRDTINLEDLENMDLVLDAVKHCTLLHNRYFKDRLNPWH